jgi:uncharacterized membrane protein
MADRKIVKGQAGTDPADALKAAGERLLGSLMQRAVSVATDRVGDLSDRLIDATAPGGPGLKAALVGGTALAEGKSPLRAALGSGLAGAKERIKNALGGRSGRSGRGGKKLKVTNIVESVDVGLPLRTTYDLWTRFTEFPDFIKKLETVEQPDDEKTTWKAQVLWSHRTWEATIVEQVPDSHIVWQSKGAKGRVDGAVTFTELGRNLTRVLVVLEYWPQGLFERTGNLWRAQGRRARLELKHFRRHAMTHVLPGRKEVEGWRGEIRDGEVVLSHEDAVKRERAEASDRDDENADRPGEGSAARADEEDRDEYEDEYDEAADDEDEYDEAADDEDEYDEAPDDEDEYDEAPDDEDEYDEAPDDEDEYDDSDKYDDEDGREGAADSEPAGGNGRRRRPVPAESGRRR